MADEAEHVERSQRRELAPSRRRGNDLWIALTALVAAMLALPLAQSSWHGPEVASTLAVSAVAMLAGQRWAIAVVFIAQVLLLPTICPRAFFGGVELWPARIAALGSVLMVVPGLLNARAAAAAMVRLAGLEGTRMTARRVHYAFAAAGILAAALPLF